MFFELREGYRKAYVKKTLEDTIKESLQNNFHFPLKIGYDTHKGRYYILEQKPFPFANRELFSVAYSWYDGKGLEYTIHDPGVKIPASEAVKKLKYNFSITAKETP
jgi:hypothetical protein